MVTPARMGVEGRANTAMGRAVNGARAAHDAEDFLPPASWSRLAFREKVFKLPGLFPR